MVAVIVPCSHLYSGTLHRMVSKKASATEGQNAEVQMNGALRILPHKVE